MTDLAIDVKNINKNFGEKHVVCDLSLQVKEGEILGFLGPNGSGKTTTIRMLCGLLTPDSGQGTCLGFDIVKQSYEIKCRVGYMTQKFSFWDDLSIEENLDFVARLYQLKNRQSAVNQCLQDLGLKSRATQLAGTLSGGWKQRLALAACMLHEPQLLLLDEPTAGVDPKARRDFWDEIHHLATKGISVLVSTHYMDEAERCHRLAYIAFGHLLTQGSAQEIIAREGLSTYELKGDDLFTVSEQAKKMPGVEQTIVFGNTLRISGKDAEPLLQSLMQLAQTNKIRYQKVDTTIEDVFIHLMDDNKEAGIDS